MQIFRYYILFFLLFSVSLSTPLTAQLKPSEQAEALYRAEDYKNALPLYKEILKSFPTNAIYKHRYGVCLYETNTDILAAEENLKFAFSKGIRLSNLYLAKIKFKMYEFDAAISYYKSYKNFIRKSDPRMDDIDKGIELCQKGMNMLLNVEDIQVLDTLIVPFNLFFNNYKISAETGSITNINTNNIAEEDSLFSLFLPEKGDRCFYSEFVDATQKRNIYRRDKLIDHWSDPKSINTINTNYNDIFPYLMSDGLTMYFCSDRPESFGGYDIYVTRYNPSGNNFLPPQPIGMPFNSFGNDYLYVIDEYKNTGWFASDRHNQKGFVTIYKFRPNKSRKTVPTESNEKLRSAALLHEFSAKSDIISTAHTKESESNQIDNLSNTIVDSIKGEKLDFRFVINDTTVYTQISDFKNRDAILTFKTLLQKQSKSDSIKSAINSERMSYEDAADESEKSIIAANIIEAESQILMLSQNIDSLEQRTRKLEIDALRAYARMVRSDETYLAPWKPKPLEIEVPKNIKPTFYNPYISTHYTEIFTPYEIELLVNAEKNKLIADNLVLDWQEILNQINKNPNEEHIIVEKLVLKDSSFAEPKTPKELAIISDKIRNHATQKYFESLTEKYEILNNKSLFFNRQINNPEESKTMRKMANEAEFQYLNAVSKTNNFTDFLYLNFDQVQETIGYVESSIDILERSIIVYKKAEQNIPAVTEDVTASPSTSVVVSYKIQIGLFKNKPNAMALSKIPEISTEPVEGTELTRYYSGQYTDKDLAESDSKKIEAMGFPGAFVVPFINGAKSTWNKVQQLKAK